jgi:hypothetical protein
MLVWCASRLIRDAGCSGRCSACRRRTRATRGGPGVDRTRWQIRHLVALSVGCLALALIGVAAAPIGAGTPTKIIFVVRGQGVLRSGPVSCARRCVRRALGGAAIAVQAVPAEHFRFKAWQGECFGVAPRCVLAADGSRTVIGVFVRKKDEVRVSAGGPGTIRSQPAGIVCGAQGDYCFATFGEGTQVTLSAQPESGFIFLGWNQGCGGTSACTFPLLANQQVTGVFTTLIPPLPGTRRLTVHFAPTLQTLHVTSDPPGIDCTEEPCWHDFPARTLVRLTADSAASWGQDCVGDADSCPVSLNSDQSVAAAPRGTPFSNPRVSVNMTEAGRGSIRGQASDGTRFTCGRSSGASSSCDPLVRTGSLVVLRAIRSRGSRFAGWRGLCKGDKIVCSFKANTIVYVNATFRR